MEISLEWKQFYVDLAKVHKYFKTNLSQNYDGLLCDDLFMIVKFHDEVSNEDSMLVFNYWDSVTIETFQPTLEEIINLKINEARIFGNEIIIKAAVENVTMGITQAGKTKEVADLFANLQYYLTTGSLHAGVAEIQRIINLGLDPELEPFVTEERLLSYKTKIEEFLNS